MATRMNEKSRIDDYLNAGPNDVGYLKYRKQQNDNGPRQQSVARPCLLAAYQTYYE